MTRPELQAPPEIFYNDTEARKYTTSSRIIEIQAKISERALELLSLPNDGVPRLLLDIGCGSGLSGETLSENEHHWIGFDISQSMLDVALEREVQGDLLLADMGQGLGLKPGVIDGAISISAIQLLEESVVISGAKRSLSLSTDATILMLIYDVFFEVNVGGEYVPTAHSCMQWLCYADKSSHEPVARLKAFFGSLYRCLARGARAVLQLYSENMNQSEMIMKAAMRAGFAGGVVVDFPHSTKARKAYLVLTCGPSSMQTSLPKGKGEDGETCSDDDESEDDDQQTVGIYDRHRPAKRSKITKRGKGKAWVLKKKNQMRSKGYTLPPDTKYTARKRKDRF